MDGNKKNLLKNLVIALFFSVLLQACLGPSQNEVENTGESSSNINTATPSNTPGSSGPASSPQVSTINYFQDGNRRASNNFLLNINSNKIEFDIKAIDALPVPVVDAGTQFRSWLCTKNTLRIVVSILMQL